MVRQGECLATIAATYGLSWKKIWDAPENDSLRDKRADPNILAPGDIVIVPTPRRKDVEAATNNRHQFTVKREGVHLYLRLLASRDPIPNEPYKLLYENHVVEGMTDGDGIIEAVLEPTRSSIELLLPRRKQSYTLCLGAIDPLDTISGAQTRLFNLGFYSGEIDGELDRTTESAIEAFQRIEELEITGVYDEQTQEALGKLYGF